MPNRDVQSRETPGDDLELCEICGVLTDELDSEGTCPGCVDEREEEEEEEAGDA
jgi:hypothetical protein